MPICEICGLEEQNIYICCQCKTRFCEECGDVKRLLCYDCIGWDDVEMEAVIWDEDINQY